MLFVLESKNFEDAGCLLDKFKGIHYEIFLK
jgi:hypothetical protein